MKRKLYKIRKKGNRWAVYRGRIFIASFGVFGAAQKCAEQLEKKVEQRLEQQRQGALF